MTRFIKIVAKYFEKKENVRFNQTRLIRQLFYSTLFDNTFGYLIIYYLGTIIKNYE